MCLDSQPDVDEVTGSSVAGKGTFLAPCKVHKWLSPTSACPLCCSCSAFCPWLPPCPSSSPVPCWTYCPDPVPSIAEPHPCISSGGTLAPSQLLSPNSFLNSLHGSLIGRARGSEQKVLPCGYLWFSSTQSRIQMSTASVCHNKNSHIFTSPV